MDGNNLNNELINSLPAKTKKNIQAGATNISLQNQKQEQYDSTFNLEEKLNELITTYDVETLTDFQQQIIQVLKVSAETISLEDKKFNTRNLEVMAAVFNYYEQEKANIDKTINEITGLKKTKKDFYDYIEKCNIMKAQSLKNVLNSTYSRSKFFISYFVDEINSYAKNKMSTIVKPEKAPVVKTSYDDKSVLNIIMENNDLKTRNKEIEIKYNRLMSAITQNIDDPYKLANVLKEGDYLNGK